jgi:predicted NACHT family NTPase
LFTAFEHKQTIPFKKHIFYRQVYDANFESHDLTKGDSFSRDKYSGLDIDDFHRVLRHIGFSCLKEQRIEFNKDEILNLISKAKDFCTGITFKESDLLKDLISTVPLFTQDGIYYRWAHKSLQEYFAAQFIYLDSKGQRDKILERIYNGVDLEKYTNILDLYYDIDYKSFRNTILYSILKDFKYYCESHYKNFESLIPEDQLKLRKELLFFNQCILFKAKPVKGTSTIGIRISLKNDEELHHSKGYRMKGHMEL